MSPLPSRLVVDNTVVSALHEADAFATVLQLWPGQWLIPLQVRDEAARWPAQGPRVTAILESLRSRSVVEFVTVEPLREGALFAQLARRLGQGESAAIAIAFHRGFGVALDDLRARRACESLSSPVPWVATEDILGHAVEDGLLPRAEAEAIWVATKIMDLNRYVP